VLSTLCDSAWISSTVSNRRPFSFNFMFGNRKKSQGAKSGEYGVWGREPFCVSPITAAASGQLSGYLAPIWLRQGACPILSSEPFGMSHNQVPLPQQCREWSDVDPDGRTLEFMQQCQELWVSVCVRHRQLMCDRSSTRHAIETTAYDSKFGPEGLFNHSKGLRSKFHKTGTKFDAHSLFLSYIPS
jgi:hypothetical protein